MLPVLAPLRPLPQALLLERHLPTTRSASRREGPLPAALQHFNLRLSTLVLPLVVLSPLLVASLHLQLLVPPICLQQQHQSHSEVRAQDLAQLQARPSLRRLKSHPLLLLEVHYLPLVQLHHLNPVDKIGSSRNFLTGPAPSGDFPSLKIGLTNPITNPNSCLHVVSSMLLLVLHLIPVYLPRIVTLAARRLIYHHRQPLYL
jgi:hypothetical protein